MKIYWRCCKSIFCLSPEQDSVANWRLPGPLLATGASQCLLFTVSIRNYSRSRTRASESPAPGMNVS